MSPEDMKRARDAIRATELDCASWPDDALDEIIAAVLVQSQPAEPVDDQFSGPDELTEAQKLDIAEARAKIAKLRPPPAPGLSAASVARAFEVMLPATPNRALFLVRNPHLPGGALSVAEYLRLLTHKPEFTGSLEQQKAEATNELWILESRPVNAAGYIFVAAATLPALAMWLQANGLAFGS